VARTEELEREINAIPYWWHSIDLGDGIVTPGKMAAVAGLDGRTCMQQALEILRLPGLAGKSILDIGAWDGFYSFEAERRGASRVVALDHYVWSIDWDAAGRAESTASPHERAEAWQPESLPGKRGFDLAHRELGSSVEPIVGDFMSMDLEPLGRFDVVLFLGVLYHLHNPFAAIERLIQVTDGLAVIESEAVAFPGLEHRALCEFFESDELAGDATNWWAPNMHALTGMCRAAGFEEVEVVVGPPPAASEAPPGEPVRYRAVVHARAAALAGGRRPP
jgi:tRNA (mo5U34)-methyltransferase